MPCWAATGDLASLSHLVNGTCRVDGREGGAKSIRTSGNSVCLIYGVSYLNSRLKPIIKRILARACSTLKRILDVLQEGGSKAEVCGS